MSAASASSPWREQISAKVTMKSGSMNSFGTAGDFGNVVDTAAKLDTAFGAGKLLTYVTYILHPDPVIIGMAHGIKCCLKSRTSPAIFAGMSSGTPLVLLFGPTSSAKFAPCVARLTIIDAARYGGREMDAIPVEAVETAVQAMCSD